MISRLSRQSARPCMSQALEMYLQNRLAKSSVICRSLWSRPTVEVASAWISGNYRDVPLIWTLETPFSNSDLEQPPRWRPSSRWKWRITIRTCDATTTFSNSQHQVIGTIVQMKAYHDLPKHFAATPSVGTQRSSAPKLVDDRLEKSRTLSNSICRGHN
jgi:hypothetical protein